MTIPAISGYTFDASRGSGSFGVVWKALWNGEFECAVKVLTPGMWHPQYLSWCLERLRREAERTDLVRIYSYDLANDPPHLAMAMMPEGALTLEQLSGKLQPREAWQLLDSLASTLSWLHGEGIVHTGLSSGNVFICGGPSGEPVVLVSDVGQGWLTGAPVTSLQGQVAYIAPEHWRAATKLLQEGKAQPRDVYAFGVIAWRLLTNSWPRGTKVFDAIAASRGEDMNLETEPFADWLEKEPLADWPSESASEEETARRKLVMQCLAANPAERLPDMKAVLAALQLIPLPAPVIAEAVESVAVELPAESPDANGDGKVDTADAFVDDKPTPPRRGFRLPKFRLPRREGAAAATPGGRRWRLATVGLTLAVAGTAVWAFKERSARITAANDRDTLRLANDEMRARLPRVEASAAAATSEAEAARAEQAAAARHTSVDLITKVLASKPVEESQLPAWRIAVRVVAEQFQAVMENAPADAAGMETRWQLARLKNALGDDAGALPLLEKLARELEASAIAAGTDFPPELIRLTGRVAALTGHILSAQNRAEDAMPHLRKASDSFERWLATHAGDTDTARALAQNLLQEGRNLAARGQAEQARNSWMKIESLIAKSDAPGFKPEDRFLLADAQLDAGRLDALQAAAEKPGENATRLLQAAISRHYDGINVLLEYDKLVDSKSMANRIRMARGYHELGRLLSRTGSGFDASVAYVESVKIYSELIKDDSDNTLYNFELCGLYNDAAVLKRDTTPGPAGAKEAMEYQNPGVDFLKGYYLNNPLDTATRLLLAASLVLNAELQQQAGDNALALKRHAEAITLTAELLAENTLSENDRREARRTSARAWTGTAGLHEKAGRRDDTVQALNKALADWESSPVNDPSDQKLMTWVKDKLSKLK